MVPTETETDVLGGDQINERDLKKKLVPPIEMTTESEKHAQAQAAPVCLTVVVEVSSNDVKMSK